MSIITPNDFFDEIIVLSLPRRYSRWTELNKRLMRENIYVKLFNGVDKNNPIQKRYYETFLHSHKMWEWSDGNYAIMSSFLNLFNHILRDTDYKQVLICEDDILFNIDFKNLFNNSVNTIPDDWLIWYLGYIKWNKNELEYVKDNNNFAYANNMTGNFAVAYKREIIPSVIAALEHSRKEGKLTTDQTIRKHFQKRYSKTYISNPMLIGHDYGWSDTANKEFNEESWGRTDKIGRYIDKRFFH